MHGRRSTRSAPALLRRNSEEAKSREDGGSNDRRNSSITRSVPVFLTSLIAQKILIQALHGSIDRSVVHGF